MMAQLSGDVLWCCVKMAIIFSESGLVDIEPPCVVQTFINHNARLFKIFVVGSRYFIIQRPSIKNFSAGGKCDLIVCLDLDNEQLSCLSY